MIDRYLLIYYREINNLTIKQLSKRIHVSAKKIAAWESGELELKDYEINKLCTIYGITYEDLLKEETDYKINIISSIIIFITLIGIGILTKSMAITIILPIISIVLLNVSLAIRNIYLKNDLLNEDEPKSLFGLKLEDNRKIIYLLESLTISSIYIIFNIICKLFNLTYFIIKITIINKEEINYIIIWLILFILLTSLVYLVEFIFGEIMYKKYKGE